ncbi:SIS domain-containing protein [Cryobacterium zongtaii]|uniref:SIS domain-containing protein n=1 Tax=Cryobacterium zongtaii TaxID=1259217 RepID=UPI0013FDFD6A|nr:SIS domain-containing protein [Cryobacterium zongtaii]
MSNHTTAIGRTGLPGSSATFREIAQQPDVWREASENVTAQRGDLDAFLAPLLGRSDLRIVLTGAGSSAFVGDIAAPALARLLSRRIEAVATTDIVSNPRECFAEDVPTLLVSFARSGNSPESSAATVLADQVLTDVSHLVITCDEAGDLSSHHKGRAKSKVVLTPRRSNDEGFAMTSSFTSMLLTSLLILGGSNDSAVAALAAAATRIIEHRQEEITALAASGFERVVYIGSGPLTGLARESALKLLELTAGQVVTYYDSALGFRHGPKAVLDDSTLALVYVSSDPYTRQYDWDIVAELRSTLSPERVITISSEPLPTAGGRTWLLGDLAGVDDAFLAVGYIVIAQLLGLAFSLELGATPDNPFPRGDVNRVVQGVHIHPLQASTSTASKES